MLDCPDLAVPREVMQHVVHVESSRNPFAIGVVGGYLARQPKNLEEALATVRQLKEEGYNFSVGISQVNRYNLAKYGLKTYEQAFEVCPNLQAGSRILRECYDRAQDWGKAFSCYYSGNFATGFRHGYVQKVFASMRRAGAESAPSGPIRIIPNGTGPRKALLQDSAPVTKQENAEARDASGLNTSENRQALPVPGPGAEVPVALGDRVGRNKPDIGPIPTQLVGVNGDPYQTRQLRAPQPAQTVVPSALPLPNPFASLEIPRDTGRRAESSGIGVSRVASPRKGGPIVHGEGAGSVARPAASSSQSPPIGGVGKASGESADQSFVF